MKILKEEKKEKLPVEFIADYISKSWEEVGNLKSTIYSIKQSFTGTKDIANILEELLDAYLITIGQLQELIEEKDIVIPTSDTKLKEELSEKAETTIAKLILDEKEAIEGYTNAIDELKDDAVYSKAKDVLAHINEEELEHIEELSNVIIDKDEEVKKDDKDDFFNSEFEEPEINSVESDFKRWQAQNK